MSAMSAGQEVGRVLLRMLADRCGMTDLELYTLYLAERKDVRIGQLFVTK